MNKILFLILGCTFACGSVNAMEQKQKAAAAAPKKILTIIRPQSRPEGALPLTTVMTEKVSEKKSTKVVPSMEAASLAEQEAAVVVTKKPGGRITYMKRKMKLLERGDFKNSSSVFKATERGRVEQVSAFIDAGLNVNQQDEHGYAPLHLAAALGRLAVAQLLLEHGADIDQPDLCNMTPLHWAATMCQTEVIQLLLVRGVAINRQDNNGNTPLHTAAMNGCQVAIQLMLEHGADINQQNLCGMTSLYYAAKKGHLGVVWLLLARGANAYLKTIDGVTPFVVALEAGFPEVAQLIKDHIATH